MTALPASSDFTGSTVTEGQFKTAITNLRDYLSSLLGSDGLNATALATLGALLSNTVDKTAAYTVALADRGKLINATNTWTLGLPAVATAGAGFSFAIRNAGTGSIVIDPAGAELINGVAALALGPGQSMQIICTGTVWYSIGGGDVAQSISDTTAGRLLAMGSLGWGGSNAVDVTDYDAITVAGFYKNATNATGSPIAATNLWSVLHMPHQSTNSAIQIAARVSVNPLQLYVRRRVSSAWAAWERLFHTGNVLGTVSQSAGVPTGALIERGSNANGEYVKFADGTLICTRTMTASAAAATTWTYPAAFIAAPVLSGQAVATVSAVVVADAAPGTTSCTFSVRDKADARRADSSLLCAIGRWF